MRIIIDHAVGAAIYGCAVRSRRCELLFAVAIMALSKVCPLPKI